MKKVRKNTTTKKIADVKTKKTVNNTVNKVVLTLKQAQTIEAMLLKAGKNSKVLSNKILAVNA